MPKKLTINDFIQKAKIVHGDKYDYSLAVYKNNSTKIKIKCLKHGEFEQTPNGHISAKNGCPYCVGNKLLGNVVFIKKAKAVHGDRYDYSKINYVNSKTKIEIVCNKHGVYTQRPCDHINQKQGCPKCIGLGRTTKNFIDDASEKHNDKYDYSKTIYEKHNKFVTIICPIHGDFGQKPYIHLMGSGCQKCSESKGEKKVALFLEKNNINFDKQKTFNDCKNINTNRQLKFDFYLPKYNLCIEYDGEYHYEPWRLYFDKSLANLNFKKMKQRDIIKNNYCINKNINLLRIPYFELKNIDKIISNYLFKND
jgi:hypothetical protein